MNKAVILGFLFTLCGCLQEQVVGEVTSDLNVLDIPPKQDYTVPSSEMPLVEGFDNEIEFFVPPQESLLEDLCFCEWRSWDDRGLMCVGVVCSESCPPEISDCREVRRACVLRR